MELYKYENFDIRFASLRVPCGNNCRGPLELPDLEPQITAAVKNFAEIYELNCRIRYQDQPRWLIVSLRESLNCVMEVAAFQELLPNLTVTPPNLFFVPITFRIDEQEWAEYSLPPEQAQRGNSFIPVDELREIKGRKRPRKIGEMLRLIWKTATAVSPTDCTHKVGPVESAQKL